MSSLTRKALRMYFSKSLEEVEEEVALETIVEVVLNEKPLLYLNATPQMLEELVVGFLLSEDIIERVSDLESIEVYGTQVKIKTLPHAKTELKTYFPFKSDIRFKLKFIPSDFKVNKASIIKAAERLSEASLTYRRTGGTHSAAIFNAEAEMISFAEDIGRHNALDKAIGMASLKGIDLGSSFLFFSGRLSLEPVLKIIRAGIPIASSLSAPTSLGIDVAEQNGLTLIGFVKEDRFNIYSHPYRVLSY